MATFLTKLKTPGERKSNIRIQYYIFSVTHGVSNSELWVFPEDRKGGKEREDKVYWLNRIIFVFGFQTITDDTWFHFVRLV